MSVKIGERLKELPAGDSVISFYERQERAPSPEVLIKFAELYDVSTDYLLGVETVNDQHLDVTGLSKREISILKEFIEILRKRNS